MITARLLSLVTRLGASVEQGTHVQVATERSIEGEIQRF